MNSQALSSQNQATANKLKNNQKCRFADMEQLHKAVNGKPEMLKQLDPKAQKCVTEHKNICADVDKIKRQSLSGMKLPQFITAVNFILAHLQENEFSLLNNLKANWSKILQALDDLKSNRKSDYSKTKAVTEFYNATKSKGLDFGNLKAKFETSNQHDLTLKKFEKDNASLTSKEIETLDSYLKTNNLHNGISNQARTGFANYKKANEAYEKTKSTLSPPLQKALENMVDSNNNNATTFQILVIDKIIMNLKDFPADKRKNFIAERARLRGQLSGYNAEHTEKSNKFLNEGIFATIAYIVKQISEEAKGSDGGTHYIEELMKEVTITSNLIEFRTHKGKNYAPYLHQGNDFSAWKHEGILYCPSKFPTKDGTMLTADETFVLDVVRDAGNPKNNHLTLVMVNHQKGIIFNTYHHTYNISVAEKDKIKAGDVLGNYWKYIKTLDSDKIVGYAKRSSADKPHLTGASSSGDYTIYQKDTNKFYAKKDGAPYYLLEQDDVTAENIDGKALKFKNEHFHVERRFVSKQEYMQKYLNKEETFVSFNNINLSQNVAKHFGEHQQIKNLAVNSSFGDLIPASALLDTGSTDSKILLDELKKLRGNDPKKANSKKAYSISDITELPSIIKGAKDSAIRDYTMLLTFENIVKLACELQHKSNQTDNCNLSQLQRQITDAKQLLVNKGK